eukprot:TRINITY_DN10288_c0_g1_i1.p1 TRINITY_DN10288_c0_g1~~TRINITY_DN10288_c0_g1_i1.p1  ORF type:complete len:115 (-),score=35.73 TRINITY_DN10288_c0_g1_i1:28-372(-)
MTLLPLLPFLSLLTLASTGALPRAVVDPETRQHISIPEGNREQLADSPPVTVRGLSDEDLQTVNPSFWDTVWDMFTMYDEHMDDRDVNQVRKMEKYHQLFHRKYPEFMPKIYHK